MSDSTKKILNSTQTIEKSLDKIIEVFTIFYGEEERENIEQRFRNMIIIGYCPPDTIKYLLLTDKKETSSKLYEALFDRLDIEAEKRSDMKKILFDNTELEYLPIHPLCQYISYLDGDKSEYKKKQVVKFLKQFKEDVTIDNLDEFIKQKQFIEIDKIIPYYRDIIEKYKQYKKSIKPYTDYLDKCEQLKKNLENKYQRQLVEELSDLFTEEELIQIQDILNNQNYFSISRVNNKTQNFFSTSLDGTSLISAFNQLNSDLLINGQSWQKKSIEQDRIKYFNNFGLNLGEDYENYKNSEQAKKLIPSQDLIIRIENLKKELYEKMMNEYYQSLQEYIINREKITKQNLSDPKDGYDANAYHNNTTFVNPNIKLTQEGYQLCPLLCICMSQDCRYLDHNLIHELNHIYELYLKSANKNEYQTICGWDLSTEQINETETSDVSIDKREDKRNYELMNEIVNELITQEIGEIMISMGVYIFSDSTNTKYKGSTSYESTYFIIKEFYQTYKQEIIISRKNNNINYLLNAVGSDNFNQLNELFNIFYTHFSGMKVYGLYEDLRKGLDTERTRIYYEICKKRDTILTNMKNHHSSKTL